MIKIVNIEPKFAKDLEELQRIAYHTLAEEELLLEEHFLSHCQVFPEGSFVALENDKVVGLGSGFLIDFDFEHPDHSFQEIIAGGSYTNHDPEGLWYYGGDISVHPQHRRKGIARELYNARKDLVKRLNKKGIVAGGVLPTYAQYKDKLSVQEYVDKVIAGEIFGRTLSVQLRNGFKVKGLLENYIKDAASDNWSTLIVWENPDYLPDWASV